MTKAKGIRQETMPVGLARSLHNALTRSDIYCASGWATGVPLDIGQRQLTWATTVDNPGASCNPGNPAS